MFQFLSFPYAKFVCGAVLAHVLAGFAVYVVLGCGYALAAMFLWTMFWLTRDDQTHSSFAWALVCGPIGWILEPRCLMPSMQAKGFANEAVANPVWRVASRMADNIAASFGALADRLGSICLKDGMRWDHSSKQDVAK